MPTPEQRLAEMGMVLPTLRGAVANYVPYVLSRGVLYVSGQLARDRDGQPWRGRLGEDMEVEEGYAAARSAATYAVAVMQTALGELTRVRRVLRVAGMVSATPDFEQHPQVVNGASDFLVAVFGEAGRHARAAVGMSSLPLGAAVEIECAVDVDES